MGTGGQVVTRYFSVYFCSEYTEYFFYFSFVAYTTERQVFITVHYVQCIVIFMAKMGSDKTCARDIVTKCVALQ